MEEDIQKQIKDLQSQIDVLRTKRIREIDVLAGAIKSKHISEGPKWVRGGVDTDKPTTGEDSDNGYATYLDTTAGKIWFYYGGAWHFASLT